MELFLIHKRDHGNVVGPEMRTHQHTTKSHNTKIVFALSNSSRPSKWIFPRCMRALDLRRPFSSWPWCVRWISARRIWKLHISTAA